MGALDVMKEWPVEVAAGGVSDATTTRSLVGDPTWQTRIASVAKPLVAYACLIAVEEGTLELEQPAGPPGSTVRHLLAHASGLPFHGDTPIARPGKRRIYSNTGYEILGTTLATAAAMPVENYLDEAVFGPLAMTATELRGSPAHGIWSTVDDLLRFGRELLSPTLVAPETLAAATTEQFPGLAGVVPEMGSYDPNPWGLGFELKGSKSPHWTAPTGSPRTFGHFGGAGTFLWVDPDAGLACAVLTNREFGEWAPPLWSALSAAVLEEQSPGSGTT
jgi:CubicO group peptidase (beta-lactamase class C family)